MQSRAGPNPCQAHGASHHPFPPDATGTQYRSGIYFHDDEQKAIAERRVAEVNAKLAKGEQVRPDRPYAGSKVRA